MSSDSQEINHDPSIVKQEDDWEVVEQEEDICEQEDGSDPLIDPLNYVESNLRHNTEKEKAATLVIKQENSEQENDSFSPYFMSEVTYDTTTEERGNDNEEIEERVVAPSWSWEAENETNDNADDTEEHHNTEKHDNIEENDQNTRQNVFIDIDYNGILSNDSDSVDNDDDDDYGKRKKKHKKSSEKKKKKKVKITTSDSPHGLTKIEIHQNPENIYIPDGWSRKVFQRLTGKYPGKLDVTYINPDGRKFKSKVDIIRYFSKHNINSEVDIGALCFGYGKRVLPGCPEVQKYSAEFKTTTNPEKIPLTETQTSENHTKKSSQENSKSKKIPLIKIHKISENRSKVSNQEKYNKEISSHNSAVSDICERLSLKDVTIEYSREDFINLTNHQVYTEYITAMLEGENPEVPASDITEVAEAKWKQFLAIKESKTIIKDDKVSQDVLDIFHDDDYEEPEDDRDEDYKEDGADSNDSDYETNTRKVKKIIKCPCCMVICSSIDALGKHLKSHEMEKIYDIDDNPYDCPHCPEKFDSIDTLFCHMETHGIIVNNEQQGSLFACIYCKKICTAFSNLKQHVNSHLKCKDKDGNVIRYNCPLCINKFTKISVLRTHLMNMHNDIESIFRTQHTCNHCPMKFNNIKNLYQHIRKNHDEEGKIKPLPDKYKCIQCEYTTNRKERFIIHVRIHTGEKPFKCKLCDHSTASISNLKLHMLIHSETKKYQCSFCDYRCNQRTSLKVHERMHTDDRPYLCSECGHRCLTKNNLATHMKNHVEGSKCLCSICGMEFLHKNSLKSHIENVHSNQSNSSKKISCPECDYMATTKGNLKVHMKVHTGEKNHMCPECGKKFTQQGSLKIHIRNHTGEKPFGCRICGYKCTTKGNLLKHMIKHGGYTSKDIFEEKWEKDDNEEFSESNCKKILSDIMKIGSNIEVDQTVVNEIKDDNQDVEIIDDTLEQVSSDDTPNNIENVKKLNDRDSEDLSNNSDQTGDELGDDTLEKVSSDIMPNNLENIEKLTNSNNKDFPNKFKQTNYESVQSNYCEPQQSYYSNVHQTKKSVENVGLQSHEKKTEDDEQHFLSGYFQEC